MQWNLYVVLSAVLSAVVAIFAISDNFFNLLEKRKKWREKRKRKKFKSSFIENNPDFEFRTGFISNSPPGICRLTISIINRSMEVKYINMISYNFQIHNDGRFLPPCQILRPGQFPKRLENGEPFHIQEDFQNILINSLYDYWNRDVKVYAICNSTVGDHLRSNSVEYDKLAELLIPLNREYKDLAINLHKKFHGSQRNIEVSLWQLQLFGRITSSVVKQLHENNIPVLQFLVANHGIVWKGISSWPQIYRDLETKKLSPVILVAHFQSLDRAEISS